MEPAVADPGPVQSIGLAIFVAGFCGVLVLAVLTRRQWRTGRLPTINLWRFAMRDGATLEGAQRHYHRWLRHCLIAACAGALLTFFR